MSASLHQDLLLTRFGRERNDASLVETFTFGGAQCQQHGIAIRQSAGIPVLALALREIDLEALLRRAAGGRKTRQAAGNIVDYIDRVVRCPCGADEAFHGRNCDWETARDRNFAQTRTAVTGGEECDPLSVGGEERRSAVRGILELSRFHLIQVPKVKSNSTPASDVG